MIFLIFYSLATAALATEVFWKTEKWLTRLFLRIVTVVRLLLLAISVILLFTLNGREILYGFWILLNVVYYILHEVYTYRRYF